MLTDAGTGTHTLNTESAVHVATVPLAFSEDFTTSFNDAFLLFADSTGMIGGAGPLHASTDGVMPDGLPDATDLYVRGSSGSDTIQVTLTRADAIADINPVNFNDDGTGTHTLTAQPGATNYVRVSLASSPFTVS